MASEITAKNLGDPSLVIYRWDLPFFALGGLFACGAWFLSLSSEIILLKNGVNVFATFTLAQGLDSTKLLHFP